MRTEQIISIDREYLFQRFSGDVELLQTNSFPKVIEYYQLGKKEQRFTIIKHISDHTGNHMQDILILTPESYAFRFEDNYRFKSKYLPLQTFVAIIDKNLGTMRFYYGKNICDIAEKMIWDQYVHR